MNVYEITDVLFNINVSYLLLQGALSDELSQIADNDVCLYFASYAAKNLTKQDNFEIAIKYENNILKYEHTDVYICNIFLGINREINFIPEGSKFIVGLVNRKKSKILTNTKKINQWFDTNKENYVILTTKKGLKEILAQIPNLAIELEQ
jgi:hypothetical protein